MIKTVFKSTTTRGPQVEFCYDAHSKDIERFLSSINKKIEEVKITTKYTKSSDSHSDNVDDDYYNVIRNRTIPRILHTMESIIMYNDEKTISILRVK